MSEVTPVWRREEVTPSRVSEPQLSSCFLCARHRVRAAVGCSGCRRTLEVRPSDCRDATHLRWVRPAWKLVSVPTSHHKSTYRGASLIRQRPPPRTIVRP